MDIKVELKANRQKMQGVAQQMNQITQGINQLVTKKRELVAEALRLEGEMRLLKKMAGGKKANGKIQRTFRLDV